jgi:hypothetical protein
MNFEIRVTHVLFQFKLDVRVSCSKGISVSDAGNFVEDYG